MIARTALIFAALLSVTVSLKLSYGASQDKEWRDFRLVDADPTEEPSEESSEKEECTAPGLTCLGTCDKVYLCRKNNGTFEETVITECKDKETCNNGACSETPTANCATPVNAEFPCSSEGMFPDQAKCKRFHYCVPDPGNKGEFLTYASNCDGDYYYNPLTTYCDRKLPVSKACPESPVPLCKTFGQTAALKGNPTLYYVCLPIETTDPEDDVLYAYLFKCDHGMVYTGNFECRSK